MKASNIIALILGILMIIGGIYCMLTPGVTYLSLAWLIGVIMLVDGIADISTWFQLRKEGHQNGWAFFAAVISIVLGIIVIGSFAAQLAVDLFIAYMIAAWLIITGIMRIMFGWSMRRVHVQLNTSFLGKHWWAPFILGILLVVVGAISLFDPSGLMLGVGMLIGLSIVLAGISVVTLAV